MSSVFICHSSTDKPFVRRLAIKLRKVGVYSWVDEAEIAIGESLVEKISEVINNVDFVGAVISEHSIESPWVQRELSLAMTREIDEKRVVVLPIKLGKCDLPPSLKDKLYADFTNGRVVGKPLQQLIHAILSSFDLQVDDTDEGLRLYGNGVAISATESSVLIPRWVSNMRSDTEDVKERTGGVDVVDLLIGSEFAAVSALNDFYMRLPDETEMKEQSTELSRKYELFRMWTWQKVTARFLRPSEKTA